MLIVWRNASRRGRSETNDRGRPGVVEWLTNGRLDTASAVSQYREMTLREYLRFTGTTATAFAARVGCHKSHISAAMSGSRGLSLDLALAIERATGGVVPPKNIRDDSATAPAVEAV